ncbi:hypothetical protein [Mesorhizobium sp. ES1-1]|uniref:hypothetical protein n=1 Tax=Mesorhizobium sp. ES1-1 TaxID=2876629 RepID=UPI001CCC5270|nr:hypothetical protein [Mesorhizobium sp. ES1-1]MBZ9678624.1 hypothetical protein [Mesorhizobium sp. ES1-1]
MATKAKTVAPGRAKATQPKANQSKATQSRSAQPKAAAKTGADAGAAVAERSKEAKPAFGKAAPKKVIPVAAKAAPKAARAKRPANTDDSISGSAMRTVKAAANVAAGAVVVAAKGTASLAASMIGRGEGSKAKAKAAAK